MPKNVIQYDLLISCPGDIQNEIDLIDRAVEDFNERFSDVLGISIRTKHWRKSSFAQSGNKPQKLLNKQFVESCDAAVALLWTRFGTPTDEYGSGTEEEIEIMLDAGKQVFMYFSDKPLSPSKQDSDEYKRVREFKRKYKKRGVYFEYCSDEDFYKLFSAHLTQYFLSLKAVTEMTEIRMPELTLCGIDLNGTLCHVAPVHRFVFNTNHDLESLQTKIKELYKKIAKMHLGECTSLNKNNVLFGQINEMWNAFHSAVEIDEERKKLIEEVARLKGVDLPEDFFLLGNLTKNNIQNSMPLGGKSYEGTEDEKRKYSLINHLYDLIIECSNWRPIESAFSHIECVELALENNGTMIDEDIRSYLAYR